MQILKNHITRLIFGCTLFFLVIYNSHGQVYDYTLKENKIDLVSSFLVWSGVHVYDHFRSAEMIDDIEDLDAAGLWSLDRGAVMQNTSWAGTWSDYTLIASVATPIIITLSSNAIKNDNFGVAVLGLQGYFMESSFTHMVKILAERPRPFVYRNAESFLNAPISKNSRKSFYSGHTSSAAYFSFFAAKIFSEFNPDSNLKPFVWGVAITLPAVTGLLRYKAGKHFPTDIITGYAVGASLGLLIPNLYKNQNVSLSTSSGGIALAVNF